MNTDTYTVKELSEVTSVSKRTILRWVKKGENQTQERRTKDQD